MERLEEELIEVVKKKVIERLEKSEANNADAEAESSANVVSLVLFAACQIQIIPLNIGSTTRGRIAKLTNSNSVSACFYVHVCRDYLRRIHWLVCLALQTATGR